jgi:4-aminobutyrate aminotransferase-like enzyme
VPPHSRRLTNTNKLFEREQRLVAPGIQSIALLSRLAIERAYGSTLVDFDGNEYLDLNAATCVAALGHAHPSYVAALAAQLETITVGSFTSRARLDLCELIAAIAPAPLQRIQFFSGGSEAVEASIRLARSYTKRSDIVGFTGGFHGKTAGVLPISQVPWKHEVGPLPEGYHVAPYPDPTLFPGTAEECLGRAIEALRMIVDAVPGPGPAAILVEPIQGTAGNVVPPPEFLARVLDVAHSSGALLIVDEMITGFGRTGVMFASSHDNVVPDIMTIGKGMASGFPISALVSTDKIVAAKPFSLPSASSSSYGGNPLAAAASLATIRTICEAGLVEHSEHVGRLFLQALLSLAERHGNIANVRGRGLLIGFDLVKPGTSGRQPSDFLAAAGCIAFFQDCLAHGLVMMAYAPRVRIHPPLILTADEVSRAVSVIDSALGRLTCD